MFGCPTYAHIAGDERSKLDAKSRQCIFLGYHKRVKGFKLWDLKVNKVVISRDVIFDERAMLHNTHTDEMQAPKKHYSDKCVV